MGIDAFSTTGHSGPEPEALTIPLSALPKPGTEIYEYLYPYLDPESRLVLEEHYGR